MNPNAHVLVDEILFRRLFNGMLLRCLNKSIEVRKEKHEGIYGEYFSLMVRTHKIIQVGFY